MDIACLSQVNISDCGHSVIKVRDEDAYFHLNLSGVVVVVVVVHTGNGGRSWCLSSSLSLSV